MSFSLSDYYVAPRSVSPQHSGERNEQSVVLLSALYRPLQSALYRPLQSALYHPLETAPHAPSSIEPMHALSSSENQLKAHTKFETTRIIFIEPWHWRKSFFLLRTEFSKETLSCSLFVELF